MKLTSILILKQNVAELSPKDIKITVISEDCSLGQAITMIESWCYANGANYPKTCDLCKIDGNIRVQITTRDNKYINIFNIID